MELKFDFSNLNQFFILFLSAQVTWHDLDHPIASRSTVKTGRRCGSLRSVRSREDLKPLIFT